MDLQKIKNTVKTKSNYQYETFDTGNKALLLDDTKRKDVFAAIDELGLKGQKALVDSQNGSVIPFPKMNTNEERVWQEYCPQIDLLENYQATQIPYEILTLIQLVKQQKYFEIDELNGTETKVDSTKVKGHIEVWSEAREDIDPLVVGVIETKRRYNWGWSSPDRSYYLLARWGISLRPFEEIRKISIDRWVEKRKAKLAASIRRAKLDYENVMDDANKHFDGRFVESNPIDLNDIPF